MLDKIFKLKDQLSQKQVMIGEILDHLYSLNQETPANLHASTLSNGYHLVLPQTPEEIGVLFNDPANRAYQRSRDRWFQLIGKAAKNLDDIEPVTPAIVFIEYYIYKISSLDHFASKFIIDGLVYAGFLYGDDINNLNLLGQSIMENQENNRTEIYIIKNDTTIKEQLLNKLNE